ncbi:hypothetical protein, partial [Eggerthella sinensis]|uniref:hypothetical protein n=1 Tax=Eggerthella sinensis TaxID=242230 RepID=UPI001D08790F
QSSSLELKFRIQHLDYKRLRMATQVFRWMVADIGLTNVAGSIPYCQVSFLRTVSFGGSWRHRLAARAHG